MGPHNFVHVDIGGLMESPSTAGRDPIFWLHHANIDRLWEVWRGLPGSIALTDPGAASTLLVTQWRSSIFVFGDPGSPATYSMDDIEDLGTLDYSYESIELPEDLVTAIEEARGLAAAALGAEAVDETEPAWEPVAATFNLIRRGSRRPDHERSGSLRVIRCRCCCSPRAAPGYSSWTSCWSADITRPPSIRSTHHRRARAKRGSAKRSRSTSRFAR
jgi:hypothetical protein